MKKKIDLVITLLTPFTSATPEKAYYDFDTRRFGYTKTGGFPCIRTARMPFALSQGIAEDENEAKPNYSGHPIIPVNTLVGILRREASSMIAEHLAASGEKMSLDLFHILDCGAHSGQPDKINSVELMKKSISHPYLGTFGGGPQMSPRFYSITNGIPITEELIQNGFVPDYLSERQPAQNFRSLTKVIHTRRVDSVLNYSAVEAVNVIENYEESVKVWIESIEKNKKDREDGASKNSLLSITTQEVVIPGVAFHSVVEFDPRGPGEAGFGLFLHALKGLSKRAIGLKVANGFGKIRLEAFVHENGARLPIFDGDGDFNSGCDTVTEALDAYAEASSSITVDSLNSLFKLEKAK